MNILMAHNYYQQPGGEDFAVEREVELLRERGNQVSTFFLSNDEIPNMSRFRVAANTLWSSSSKRSLKKLLQSEKPDVVHFRNTFPLISPAAYYAAREEDVPVVQMLSNYRLLCPNALFRRDGHICEDCTNKLVPWPGVFHACYRNSRAESGVVASMLTLHRFFGTWKETVDLYIAPTAFIRDKFVANGFPEEKIVVKPNFVDPDPGAGEGVGGYALFVGRLSDEKGVETMLQAWELMGDKIPLKIAGDGPLADCVTEAAERSQGIQWLGRVSEEQVTALMKDAVLLIVPSDWYEVFGLVIIEAFATGLPVIASDIGSMSTLVDHERTGFHFHPGDPEDLARQVENALGDRGNLALMRATTRAEFEANYTADQNYHMLKDVYRQAMDRRRRV